MRYIFLLVVFLSCQKEELKKECNYCFTMEISDSIPIQFWINGQETFNENPECGLTEVCFCQPFNYNDNIVLQFTDDSERDYGLRIYDVDGNILDELPFTVENINGVFVYSLEFTFQSISVQKVRLQIFYSYYSFSLTSGLTDLVETVSGTATFLPSAVITASITDLLETPSGFIATHASLGIENDSLDISITAVRVNGVTTIVTVGSLPNTSGNSTEVDTKETGTQTIEIDWSASISGQHISMVDSNATYFCDDIGTGSGTVTFVGASVKPESQSTITASDGIC